MGRTTTGAGRLPPDRPVGACRMPAPRLLLAAFVLAALSPSVRGSEPAADPKGEVATEPQAGPVAVPVPDPASAVRHLLYPRWDPASGLAGEPFRSSSLAREAPDMRLADFRVVAVPDSSRLVAAALLEPQGFPAPYTLLEVAVLDRDAAGLRLLDNLKVRVDRGSGPGGLRMGRPRAERPDARGLGFEVPVTDDADRLRHRFRHDRGGIRLVESTIARR
jgi:hypothetical protein